MRATEDIMRFFKHCIWRGQSLFGEMEWVGAQSYLPLPWNVLLLRYSLLLFHIYYRHALHASIFVCTHHVYFFICCWNPEAKRLHLRYAVSYHKIWTFKDYNHLKRNFDNIWNLQCPTHWYSFQTPVQKRNLTILTNSDLIIQRFALLLVIWDINVSLFTKHI